jgi:hypothetical protein
LSCSCLSMLKMLPYGCTCDVIDRFELLGTEIKVQLWNIRTSDLWHYVEWYISTDVSKESSASIFKDNFLPWIFRVFLTSWYPYTRQHSLTFQGTVTFLLVCSMGIFLSVTFCMHNKLIWKSWNVRNRRNSVLCKARFIKEQLYVHIHRYVIVWFHLSASYKMTFVNFFSRISVW